MEQVMQRPTRPKNKSKFKIKGFLRLIAQIKPKYWQLGVGLLLGMIATGMQLAVPKFAKDLINQLGHHLNTQLVIGVILLFVASG